MEIVNKTKSNHFFINGWMVSRRELHRVVSQSKNPSLEKMYKKWVSGREADKGLVMVTFDTGQYSDSVVPEFPFIMMRLIYNLEDYKIIKALNYSLNTDLRIPSVLAAVRKKYPKFKFHLG